MMTALVNRTAFVIRTVVAVGLACTTLPGCGNQAGGGGCQCQPLTLPDGDQTCACPGAGVKAMRESDWEVAGVFASGRTQPLIQVSFGERGAPDAVQLLTEPIDLPAPLGSLPTTFAVDGRSHPTGVPFVDYAASAYGAETQDESAMSFRIHGKIVLLGRAAIHGDAIVDAWWDDDGDDRITGTISYAVKIDIGFGIPAETLDGEVGFDASLVAAR